MAKFTYTAIAKDGKRITGQLDASDKLVAMQSLQRRGIRPMVVKEQSSKGDFLKNLRIGGNKVKPKDLVVFTRQLATMINAGVPLVRSLNTLSQQTENEYFEKHIIEITKEVESGMSFADTLAKHKEIFSPIYINMVAAGETGGILDEILKKLAQQQEKDAKIRGKFKSAMTYPIILLSITFLVFFGLMLFVMPQMGKIIKDLGGPDAEMPPLTQTMLAISGFMTNYWYIIIGLIVFGVFFLKRYTKTSKGRKKKDQLLMKIPVISTIVKKVAIARFARIFASLMSAGVSVIDTLEVTSRAIGNAVIEEELMRASKAVTNGQQLSQPLSESTIFPPIVSQMLAIGEETGQTDEILLKVADFYEEEIDATVESLSSILEPIMIVVMGGMVGLVAASVMGPIGNLSTQI